MRSKKFPSYEERFCHFSKSIEKGLLTLILVLFISLVAAQGLLHIDSFRTWFVEVERLEGVAS